jgi:histone H3/H4
LDVPAGVDDQTTFVLSDPVIGDAAPTSPLEEPSFTEAAAAEVAEGQILDPVDDVSDRGDFGNEPMFFDDAGSSSDVDAPAAAATTNEDDTRASTTLLLPKARREEHRPRKKQKRVSRHDIEYPPLPPAFVKKVAQTALQSSGISNPRITADTLEALTQASDWFFEQLGDDLGAYANHAKRKTIEESDVATLMRR